MSTVPKDSAAAAAAAAAERISCFTSKEVAFFSHQAMPLAAALIRIEGDGDKETNDALHDDAVDAMNALADAFMVVDLDHWLFTMSTMLFVLKINGNKLAALWRSNERNLKRMRQMTEQLILHHWPFIDDFLRHADVREMFEHAVLPNVTVKWSKRVLCNAQMFEEFGRLLTRYVFTARCEDADMPADMRSERACNLLGMLLAAIAARHTPTLLLLASLVTDEPRFEWIKRCDGDVTRWSVADVDALRLKASEIAFTPFHKGGMLVALTAPIQAEFNSMPRTASGRMTIQRPIAMWRPPKVNRNQ